MPADLIRWPRFAGSPKNAATLSANLTRKAQIVEELVGVKLTLVQGAPSGSNLSGGTHYGPGNAADWATTWNTKTDLAISQAFRRLNCISWIRGQDADGDGRKDDSFDPHIHVIDVDDESALNAAQRQQLAAYRNGRNALINNLRDKEPRPKVVQTLAQYLATTSALDAAGTDRPTPKPTTTQEYDMPLSPEDLTKIADVFTQTVNAVDVENQRRITALTQKVDQLTKIATENQRRLGWQAKDDSISNQIKDQ